MVHIHAPHIILKQLEKIDEFNCSNKKVLQPQLAQTQDSYCCQSNITQGFFVTKASLTFL